MEDETAAVGRWANRGVLTSHMVEYMGRLCISVEEAGRCTLLRT